MSAVLKVRWMTNTEFGSFGSVRRCVGLRRYAVRIGIAMRRGRKTTNHRARIGHHDWSRERASLPHHSWLPAGMLAPNDREGIVAAAAAPPGSPNEIAGRDRNAVVLSE